MRAIDAETIELVETERINFPNFIHKKVLNKNLLIAPEYPTWIVLDDDEYDMFRILCEHTIEESLAIYRKNIHAQDPCSIRMSVLEKIFNNNFYREGFAQTQNEEIMDNIQKSIHINVINDCNMRCKHCFINAGRVEKQQIDIENILAKVRDITIINGYTSVTISGGEPLLHKNIFSLLEGLRGHKVSLFTNGILINESIIDKLQPLVSNIQISMEGISAEKYEQNRGYGNYKKVLQAINLIKAKNIPLYLAVTILPDTLLDIEENLVDFVKMLDYKNMQIRLNNEIEMSGAALHELDLRNYDMQHSNIVVFNLMKKLGKLGFAVEPSKVKNIRFKNCGIGTSIVIDSDGKIYPCSYFSSYHIPYTASAKHIIKEFNTINNNTSIEHIEKCKDCELKYICSGGCKINNLVKNKNMIFTSCNDDFKQKQLEKLVNSELL
ncbi:MAG: radical SAM protein [Helicobacter sp.]|uniref:radical SAM/SPASM domain-containing protein n=1 Tax=Helicobacter sp. TaxID=218 RepID=UPI002A9144CF|nr:radical SAM protein [Helicobacter sp.]MDY5822408.1 radical SAM protein [Helicobacter sp.]